MDCGGHDVVIVVTVVDTMVIVVKSQRESPLVVLFSPCSSSMVVAVTVIVVVVGDTQLLSYIELDVAAVADKNVDIFTFNNYKEKRSLDSIQTRQSTCCQSLPWGVISAT